MLQFRGSVVTYDAGLLANRELDDVLGLIAMAGEMLADALTARTDAMLIGLLRQSVFGRLAGYKDVNDAERLRHDPAMHWIVGGKAAQGCAVRSPIRSSIPFLRLGEERPFSAFRADRGFAAASADAFRLSVPALRGAAPPAQRPPSEGPDCRSRNDGGKRVRAARLLWWVVPTFSRSPVKPDQRRIRSAADPTNPRLSRS